MQSKAKTVAEYIASLPEDRRGAIKAVRDVVKKHLPAGYREGMDYGYIGWSVPLSVYPDTYNGQPLCYAALASQKNHMALYLMCAYAEGPIKQRLVKGFKEAGKKLDMGKACIRFKQLEDLPLDVIAEVTAAVPMKKYVEIARAARAKKK
jgi:uncharacterized protein YdhG (YjbR/CyaY superfamily)